MTDLPLPPATHPPPPQLDPIRAPDALFAPPPPVALTNGFAALEEEEPYTIKCICGYQDDDGATIQCEACETWQHIECYYGGKKTPGEKESHFCVECAPRALDGKRATERQRARREELELGDKRPKKPAAKSHKKKPKTAEQTPVPVNGWAGDRADAASPRNGASGSPREQPPAKKQKTGHKASNSVQTSTVPLKPPGHARRSTSASHPLQSPTKTPILSPTEPPYSYEFMHLYDDDPGDSPMQANLFNDISTTSNLSLWSHDVEAVEEVTKGKTQQDIFMRCEQTLDSMALPPLSKHVRVDDSVQYHGRSPKWMYLTVDSDISENMFIGELRGKIGHMTDYVQDESNRWEYLRHPLPFVFFHPHLPIYVDTRREGTICRYLRRSCQPNVTMKTILENDVDYHFCFVATRDLEAGAELTIPWTLDEHIRAHSQQLTDLDETYVMHYFARLSADFGGCACDAQNDCLVAKWERESRARAAAPPPGPPNGKAKRSRKAAARPNNPHPANVASRSGSEARRGADDEDPDDARSTSPSSKSKTHSRDLTPSNPGPEGKGVAPGIELSDREKRKIEALEKKERDKNQPAPKRKKRNSGGSTAHALANTVSHYQMRLERADAEATIQKPSSTNASTSTHPAPGPPRPGDGRPRHPDSPSPPAVPRDGAGPAHSPSAPPPHRPYVDAATQTDPDPEYDGLAPDAAPPHPAPPRPRFVPLTERLLRRSRAAQRALEAARAALQATAITRIEPPAAPDPGGTAAEPSGAAPRPPGAAPVPPGPTPADGGDVAMHDAPEESSPTAATSMGLATDAAPPRADAATTPLEAAPAPVAPLDPPPLPAAPGTAPAAEAMAASPTAPASASAGPSTALACESATTSTAPASTSVATSPAQPDAPLPPPPAAAAPALANGTRPSDLRVQLPPHPPWPAAVAPPLASPATTPGGALIPPSPATATTTHALPSAPPALTPSSAAALTPAAVAPSPIKKKMSLGDYMRDRRGSHKVPDAAPPPATPGVVGEAERKDPPATAPPGVEKKGDEPSAGADAKPFGGAVGDAAAAKALAGSAVVETPAAEAGDPMEVEKTG